MSYASVMGIKKDIHLKGDDYQWLGSMFYFGMALLLNHDDVQSDITQVILHGNIPPTVSSNACHWPNTPRSALSYGASSFAAWLL